MTTGEQKTELTMLQEAAFDAGIELPTTPQTDDPALLGAYIETIRGIIREGGVR